jgi:CRISPR-associated protein Cst2
MIMKREGLTITMIFLAESANYGEGIGNIFKSNFYFIW